jgi:DNA-binding CsgD family transcriptional regulator
MTACRGIVERDRTADGLTDMAEALSQVEDAAAAFDILASFVRDRGFVDVTLTIEANDVSATHGETRWSTLGLERLAALEATGFDGHDPIRRFARRTIDPFVWTASDWPRLNSGSGREVIIGQPMAPTQAGMTTVAFGRAGRMAVLDAFGIPERIRALSPATREAVHLAAAMTFRAIERLSLIPGGADLTRREIEILDLASQGLTMRTIAGRLQIVEQTVKFHLKNIRVKLNARNKSEAIAKFAALDLSTHAADCRSFPEVHTKSNQALILQTFS